jgi:hypothetical protein
LLNTQKIRCNLPFFVNLKRYLVRASSWQRFVFILTFLIYSVLFIALPKNVFWSPDEGFRLMMARSLTTAVSSKYPLVYPGSTIDSEFRFFPNFYKPLLLPPSASQPNATVQYPWPNGFPWLTGLLYRALGAPGLYLIPWLSGLLVLWFCWRIARRVDPQGAFWVVPMVGIGTPVLFYSLSYWDHTLAVLFGLAALWLVTKPTNRPWLNTSISFLLAILAMLIRVEMAVWVLALSAGWGMRSLWGRRALFPAAPTFMNKYPWRRASIFGLLFLALVLLAVFIPRLIVSRHLVEFQNFTASFGRIGLVSSLYLMAQRVFSNLPGLLISVRSEEGPPLDSVWIWVGLVFVIVASIAAWIKNWKAQLSVLVPSYLALLLLCAVVTFMDAPFRAMHGIFVSAPLIALAVLVFPQAFREKHSHQMLAVLSALFYMIGGVVVVLLLRGRENGGFWPGLEWGPRYLLMVYPLFGILSLWAVQRFWQSKRPAWARKLLVALSVLLIVQSTLLQARGMMMLFENKTALSTWQTYLLEPKRSGSPVMTDIWWLPESLAEFFTTHEMFYMSEQGEALQWLKLAASKGVTRFTFIDASAQDLDWMDAGRYKVIQTNRAFINGLYFTEYQLQINAQ